MLWDEDGQVGVSSILGGNTGDDSEDNGHEEDEGGEGAE